MATSVHPESRPIVGASLPQGKLNSVQGLRAIAVLLVVWTHSIVAAGYHSTPKQGEFFHLKSFGACGLDIFFVISGFIVSLVATRAIAKNRQSAGTFLYRRITRIFPLYWILTGVIILEAELGTHPILWHKVPWIPTLTLLPPWQYPVPPLVLSLGWSLIFEIYFYLVLAAWMRITPRHLVRNSILFLGLMVAIGMIVGLHHPLLVIWSNPMALEFVFGALIAQIYLRIVADPMYAPSRTSPDIVPKEYAFGRRIAPLLIGRSPLGPWLATAGAIGLVTTIFTGYGNAGEASSIMAGLSGWLRLGAWGFPSALLVLGGVLWNPTMQSQPARLLVFLGDASYSIYLCTNPTRSAVEHFWRFFGRWGGDAGVFLCLLACIFTGIICYLFLERPLMRFFRKN